jgi:hypothetical protein
MESDQQIAAAADQQVKGKPRGRPFPPGVSGNPSGVAKQRPNERERIAELFSIIAADYGELTGIERVVQQAARLLARAEKAADADIAVRASNAASRMLATLKRKRHRPGAPPMRERVMEAAGE